MQEAHQQTLVPAYEQISVSLEPLISLVPGLAIVLARDRIIPRIYMRLHWTQMVPRRELMQELTWIEDEGILGLKQKVESRRLSVNAYEEYGLSLLFYVSPIIHSDTAVCGLLISMYRFYTNIHLP